MKAIVVRQPWAALIALGVKTIETRPAPPSGPMRPAGVRGLPGCTVERGEVVAIAAGAVAAPFGPAHHAWTELARALKVYQRESHVPDGEWLAESVAKGGGVKGKTPLGAVVCTAAVADALPIVPRVSPHRYEGEWGGHHRIFSAPHEDYLSRTNPRGGPPTTEGVAHQLPLGDFTPGRWGWMLADPQPCDPVPVTGRQGVFVLPDGVSP